MTSVAIPLAPDAMSPPRESQRRLSDFTDLTKASVPLPFMLSVIGSVIVIAFFVFQIKSDVRLIEERQQHQKETTQLQFDELKALVAGAGLRNANMSMAQEMSRVQQENTQLREQLKERGAR